MQNLMDGCGLKGAQLFDQVMHIISAVDEARSMPHVMDSQQEAAFEVCVCVAHAHVCRE